jgi:uncharacterized protein YbaP (TraB family)
VEQLASNGGRIASASRPSIFKRAQRLALALGLIAAPLQAAAVPSFAQKPSFNRATPALWAIRDADTVIYLFGTFHTLDGQTVWFDHKVRQAFDQSQELVLETVVPQDLSQFRDIVRDESGKVKPFIAQTRAVVRQGAATGMSLENGADSVLRRVADTVGKPVGGLERFEEQLGTLASIPATVPATTMPVSQPAISITMNDLLRAWSSGNTNAFSTMLAGFEAKSPTAYRMLITDRNARWGQWIAQRLDQPGTVFVAVGSGHLAGRHSVQNWLASRGIAATRIS